jgi:hypothetical protein
MEGHSGESTLLEIVFRNVDFSTEERDKVEDALHEALLAANMGEVTGGGRGTQTSAIDVEVRSVVHGVELVRQTLSKLGCPAGTEIHQTRPSRVIHRL